MSKTQYLITDPCYVLPDEVWNKCCDVALDDTPEAYDRFDDTVTEELKQYSGSNNAKACRTGFGDWCNKIDSSGEGVHHIIHSEFGADSGMVCVVEYTDRVKAEFSKHLFKNGCAALIETEGDVTIYLHQDNPEWTEVEIIDLVPSGDRVYKSIPADSEKDYDADGYDIFDGIDD